MPSEPASVNTSSTMPPPREGSKIFPNRDQVFNYMSLWGHVMVCFTLHLLAGDFNQYNPIQ